MTRRKARTKKKAREQREMLTTRLGRLPGLAKSQLHVFLSYCRQDHTKWIESFRTMLKGVDNLVIALVDRDIAPGEPWLEELNRLMGRAGAALLLVTPNYMASDFIRKYELPKLLEANDTRRLRIFWVPVTATLYAQTALQRLNAAHDPSRPLDSLRPAKRNLAIASICEKILDLTPNSLVTKSGVPPSFRQRERAG